MATNGTSTGTQYPRNPTDYNLKQLSLLTSMTGQNAVVDLMPFMVEIDLYEDIYSATISGEVVLQDSLGLISNYLLNGTEFIQIQLQKTSQDNVFISRNYRVYKISKREISDSNQYEVYVLNFCSEEFLLSEQYRISKSARGKQISDIITDIMNTYVLAGKGNKKLYIDSTKGVYDFVLPNKKIFETINWLSTYAQPFDSKSEGADMLFYENSTGYHFHSLQTLYQLPSYQTYRFDPKNILESAGKVDISQQLTNATDFEVLDFFDTLGGISNGTFGNKVIVIDPLLRRYDATSTVFNYNKYSGVKLNSSPLTNGYQNRLNGTMYDTPPTTVPGLEMGALRMATSNKDEKKNAYVSQKPDSVANDIMIEKYLPNRVAQLALANYMRIKVTIPGDASLVAGSVVNFNTYGINPVTFSQTGTRTPDPLYSGKYLVTAVRHIVKNNGYITVMEMCKDSVATPYSTNNSGLQQVINGVQI
jgi:hypothetical protein